MKRRFSTFRCALFGLLLNVLVPSVHSVIPPPDGGYRNQNTAEGTASLFSLNVTASLDQTAIGYHALHDLSTAPGPNTVVGTLSYSTGMSGSNVAVGFKTLSHENIGYQDVAIGTNAMFNHNDGFQNVAAGANALKAVTSGLSNTSVGSGALQNGQPGYNTAIGYHAYGNGTFGGNTVIGSRAFATGNSIDNVVVGCRAMSQLNGGGHPTNIAIGFDAGSQQGSAGGGRNIDIGNPGEFGDSKILRIGTAGLQNTAFIAGITDVTVADGIGVLIDSNGHIGTANSSARYKEQIKPMGEASDVLYSLQPVSFQYRSDLDPSHVPQFGLVAEDVARVAPALVVRDREGRPYAVRYQAINTMVLNEFQKDHRTGTQQEASLKTHTNELDNLSNKVANLEQALEQHVKVLTNIEARMD